ncbi:MAG: helix-turn-helix domain-containing protein [Bryobacteraceae bacterium]
MEAETGEQTIRRVLSSYELGPKLRQLRLRKKIGLKDLSAHTGLSASLLSQLENGKLVPTLPTLVRIALVFDVSLEHFFGDQRPKRLFAVVRAGERIRFPERPDAPSPAYFFECLAYPAQGKGMEAYLAELPRRLEKETQEHVHEGHEFLFVVDGKLVVRHRSVDHSLSAGDSVYFDSSEPHSYRGLTEPPARAVVVTLPPRP